MSAGGVTSSRNGQELPSCEKNLSLRRPVSGPPGPHAKYSLTEVPNADSL